jgi:putative transposase
MAAKNSIKEYAPDGYYHLYNRGVEKRTVFLDAQDYAVFLSYLKTYLTPKNTDDLLATINNPDRSYKERNAARKALQLNNFADTFTLLCYCLMPNHFHFLVKQKEEDTIDRFMNSLGVRYSMYFNRKYRRVGGLFQGVYKAVRVISDEQLLHLSRYIHRNPITLASQDHLLHGYSYSSYLQYLGHANTEWVHPKEILGFYPKSEKKGYQKFVEGSTDDDSAPLIAKLTIDDTA